MTNVCLFCGGDGTEAGHLLHCDGRQGRADSLYGSMGNVPFEQASDTSAAAAQSLNEALLSHLEQVVFDVIKRQPRTCDAVEEETGFAHQTVGARIRGLVLRGRLIDSGKRAKTRYGRNAVIW